MIDFLSNEKLQDLIDNAGNYNPFSVEASKEILHLRGENQCDACGGTGTPVSGSPCMCGGTGKMSDAAYYLRQIYVKENEKWKLEYETSNRLYGDLVLLNTNYDEALGMLARAMSIMPDRDAFRVQSLLDRRSHELARVKREKEEKESKKLQETS